MESLINFRDFGGISASDGRTVRSAMLYRCGHLNQLSPAAAEQLAALDLTTIADLRYASERHAQPSLWPGDWAERVLAHDQDRTHDAPHLAMLRDGTLSLAAVELFYDDLYRTLPFAPPYRRLFARAIERIATQPGATLVHCTAGKDRTGIFCALLLSLLGVPRDAIMADYLHSRGDTGLRAMKRGMLERTRERYGHKLDSAAVEALLDVKPEYLSAAFEAILVAEGSIEAYFRGGGLESTTFDRLRFKLVD
ncbi:MAG: tyrosine-protein phosphatase [Sphingomonadales bacterium]|nr:MAG: tyrosine-protein phosphatase [Sphingomonadales bacterium]